MLKNYKDWKKMNEQDEYNLDDLDLDSRGMTREDILNAIKEVESDLYFTEGPEIEEDGDGYLVISFAHDRNYHGIHEINVRLVFKSHWEDEEDEIIASNMGIEVWSFESASISYEHNSPDFDWDDDTDDPRANYDSDDYEDANGTDEADRLRDERYGVHADWIGKPIETPKDLVELLTSYQNLSVVVHLPSETEKIDYTKEWGVAKEDERLLKAKDKLQSEAEASRQLNIELFKQIASGEKKDDPEFIEMLKKTMRIKDSDLEDFDK